MRGDKKLRKEIVGLLSPFEADRSYLNKLGERERRKGFIDTLEAVLKQGIEMDIDIDE